MRRAAPVAVIPAHDEEATIAATVAAVRDLPTDPTVVVVADGCSDRTAEAAATAGAAVAVSERRLGKGAALELGIDAARRAPVYLFVDGDVGASAAKAGALLREVLEGRMDLAIGVLPPHVGGGLGTVRRFAGAVIRGLSGFPAEAPLSGQRAMTAEVLDACRPLAAGFGVETAMTVDAVRLGFRVGEVPVAMSHRATGRTAAGFAHRGRQGFDIARASAPRLLRVR